MKLRLHAYVMATDYDSACPCPQLHLQQQQQQSVLPVANKRSKTRKYAETTKHT
jgi:hypothetical protein